MQSVRFKNCLTQNFLKENIIFTDGNQEKFWVIKRYEEGRKFSFFITFQKDILCLLNLNPIFLSYGVEGPGQIRKGFRAEH
jgi:hypothetical protein